MCWETVYANIAVFYVNIVDCFLKLLMILKFHIDQHENLFASLCFVAVSERSSYWQCSSKLLSHKLLSWTFVFKIFEKYKGRSSILLKSHVCKSVILLETKLLNKYFPIASSASTNIYFVEHLLVAASVYDNRLKTKMFLKEKYIWIKDYDKRTWLVNTCELCCSNVPVEN